MVNNIVLSRQNVDCKYNGGIKKMANRFVLNETSYHGKGAIKEIVNEIKARGFGKVLVCVDPDLIKFGVAAKVTDLLDQAKIPYEIFI